MSDNDNNFQYQDTNSIGHQYQSKKYQYTKYKPPSQTSTYQYQQYQQHQYQLPTHHNTNTSKTHHYKSINLLECGSWYYCYVVTALMIAIILLSVILSRIPYDPPTIKILNYHNPYDNLNEGPNLLEIEAQDQLEARLIASDPWKEDVYTTESISPSITYKTPIDPVCIFKSKHNNLNVPTTITKKELCNLIVDGIHNIHAPSSGSSFTLYKVASVCGISDPASIKLKKTENDMQKLVHSVLDKDNGPVVGICDKSHLLDFHKNGLIEPFIIDGKSCFDNVNDYIFNVVLTIE